MFVKLAAAFVIIFAAAAVCVAGAPATSITLTNGKAIMATPTFGAAYGNIASTGDDTLDTITSECCAAVELHQSSMIGGVMRMRQLEHVKLGADKPLRLAQHGSASGDSSMHIMLIDAKKPLKARDSIDITFTFAKAGAKTFRFAVETASSK
jgi:copper(I)-binding protein